MGIKDLPLPVEQLEQTISYNFKNPAIISEALIHSSYSNEARSKGISVTCNERMEFLGDSVLSLTVSEYLYDSHPDLPEGDLSRIRAAAVCEKTLSRFAKEINLGSYLMLGHGEEITNGRTRPSTLADAYEALIAALFIDGGINAVKSFLLPVISAEIDRIIKNGSMRDYKTVLQQIIQQGQGELLEYVTIRETGPAHKRLFEVEARLNSNIIGRGNGSSKREAEQLAAKEALVLFGEQ